MNENKKERHSLERGGEKKKGNTLIATLKEGRIKNKRKERKEEGRKE